MIYTASATAEASSYTKSGQLVTASASATASSSLSYDDAYNIALKNAKSTAQQNAIIEGNILESKDCCLPTFYASASAGAEVEANNGQLVTASSTSTATSTLNYKNAYEVAYNNAESIAKSTAENNANIINQAFPGLITLENLSTSNNVYNIHDNSNYYYIKGSSGNSVNMPPTFFSLGKFGVSPVKASAIDSKGNLYVAFGTGNTSVYSSAFSTTIANINGLSSENNLFTTYTNIAMWDGSTWSPLGTGIGEFVNAIAIDSQDNVYVGGGFTTLGDFTTSANSIAKWTPSSGSWSVLGDTTNSTINATVNGLSGSVNALAIDSSNNVYVGGDFTIINDGSISNSTSIAVTNNTTIPLSLSTSNLIIGMILNITGYPSRSVSILTISTSSITVSFSVSIPANTTIYFSSKIANRIAKWTPSYPYGSWSVLGDSTNSTTNATVNGLNNGVNALAIDSSNNVYVGGDFTIINDGSISTDKNNIVNENNNITFTSSSITLNVGMTVSIKGYLYTSLTIIDVTGTTNQTSIIVSSFITIPAGTLIYFSNKTANRIAKWTHSSSYGSWSVLGNTTNPTTNTTVNGLNNEVNALAIDSSNNVYAGGSFTLINDGTISNSTSSAVNSDTIPLFLSTSNLVVGMILIITGQPTITNIEITAITASSITVSFFVSIPANTTIYFSNKAANRIAKWTSSSSFGSWSVLGDSTINGLNDRVYALAIDSNNNAYASGSFTKFGDNITDANNVAKWTPSNNTLSTVGGKNISGDLIFVNGLPSSSSSIVINKKNNTIYAASRFTFYQLFSDYVNLQYNGIILRQLYLNGQIVSVYTNNKNGKKMCGVVNQTVSYQNYF